MTTWNVQSSPSPNEGAESSSKTDFKVLNCSHIWTIKNFSSCWMKPGEVLNSPTFFSKADDTIKWCLNLYPGGESEDNKDEMPLYLMLVSSYSTEVQVTYNFSIIDENQIGIVWEETTENKLLQKIDGHRPMFRAQPIPRGYLMDKANGLLPEDCLTILCEVSASTVIVSPSTSDVNILRLEKWGSTRPMTINLRYTWTIHDFSFCRGKTGESMKSPIFSADADSKLKWKLMFFPNGQIINGRKYTQYASIFLKVVENNQNDTKATFKIGVINAKGEKTNESSINEPCTFLKGKTLDIGFKKFVRRAVLLNKTCQLLPDDKLTIFCEIKYAMDTVGVSGGKEEVTSPEIMPQYWGPEVKMLPSDVTLVVGE